MYKKFRYACLIEDHMYIKYACIDASVAYKIKELLQNKYDCNVHVSLSPIPDSSTDNDEDK